MNILGYMIVIMLAMAIQSYRATEEQRRSDEWHMLAGMLACFWPLTLTALVILVGPVYLGKQLPIWYKQYKDNKVEE